MTATAAVQMGPSVVRVLITDGDQRAALALVRSLSSAGYLPFVVSSSRSCLAGSSRYSAGHAITPDPVAFPEEFTRVIRTLISKWGISIVIPTSEGALLSLLPIRNDLPVQIPFPDIREFRAISDKKAVLEIASTLGIAVPKQCTLHQSSDAELHEIDTLSYPVVIKPARSVSDFNGVRTKLGVSYAGSPSELRERIRQLNRAAFPVLLQEYISGPGLGMFMLLWQGKVLAAFSHRRLREKPPSGGVSVYSESIALDPSLAALSRDLLIGMNWDGVAMVEYKIDAETGIPYLMEVNGRFWGSLQLAITAGVDFPVLLVGAMEGKSIEPVLSYRIGVRNRWWWGDVDQLIIRMAKRDNALKYAPVGSRARALLEFATIGGRRDYNEVFRWSDPMPFLRESWDWFRRR